jgi:hypothetical protein
LQEWSLLALSRCFGKRYLLMIDVKQHLQSNVQGAQSVFRVMIAAFGYLKLYWRGLPAHDLIENLSFVVTAAWAKH